MNLRKKIAKQIKKSGLESKEVLAILDDIRKEYHNPKNVGDKVISEREHSPYMAALIGAKLYALSKDKAWVFHKGGWKKIYKNEFGKYIKYLGNSMPVSFKKL